MTDYVLPLPYTAPPLQTNQHPHWRTRAKFTKQIHEHLRLVIAAQRVPSMRRAEVVLHYAPRDRRRRDVDNLVPTSKAALDGIVRAGVLPDDSPEYVDHLMPVIHPKDSGPPWPHALWVSLRELD